MTVATRCCSFIRDENFVIAFRRFGLSFDGLGRIIEIGVRGVER